MVDLRIVGWLVGRVDENLEEQNQQKQLPGPGDSSPQKKIVYDFNLLKN